MLRKPTKYPGFAWNSPAARARRFLRAMWRGLSYRGLWAFLAGAIIAGGACWLVVRMDFDRMSAERDSAREQLAQLAEWHRGEMVQVSLMGNPAQVANLARQVSAAVRP
jgi:hypothetical protein